MPALSPLEPAPSVSRPPIDIIALEGGRSSGGIVATLQAVNGTVQAARLVKLADQDDRKAFAGEVAQATGIPATEVESALLELLPAVEVSLRDQKSSGKKNDTQAPTAAPSATGEDLPKDYGHASVLAEPFRNKYRWAVHRGAWMRYDGKVWRQVPDEAVAKEAADTLRELYLSELTAAIAAGDKGEIARLTEKIEESCVYARITGALSFLKGWDHILTLPEQWNADPYLLNCGNGTLDLRALGLRPHSAKDLITMLAPVDYDPTAQSERWDHHVNMFLPDTDVRRQVQRDLGRSLVGAALEEALPIWYGGGANGKTTTSRVIMRVTGDYSDRAAPDLLLQSKSGRHPTELADLAGKRMVFSVEVDEGRRLAEALVKDLTGGDRKKARFLFRDFFSFEQTADLVLIVNHRPQVQGTDEGIWRRIRLIPWTVRIPDAQKRPQDEVIAELVADGPAILRWLVDGWRDWQQEQGWTAETVKAATTAYRAEQDILAEFIAQCCVLHPRAEVGKGELYAAYKKWCERAHDEPIQKNTFIARIQDRGIGERKGSKGVRLHVGIGLRADWVAEGGGSAVTSPHVELAKGTAIAPPSATHEDTNDQSDSRPAFGTSPPPDTLIYEAEKRDWPTTTIEPDLTITGEMEWRTFAIRKSTSAQRIKAMAALKALGSAPPRVATVGDLVEVLSEDGSLMTETPVRVLEMQEGSDGLYCRMQDPKDGHDFWWPASRCEGRKA